MPHTTHTVHIHTPKIQGISIINSIIVESNNINIWISLVVFLNIYFLTALFPAPDFRFLTQTSDPRLAGFKKILYLYSVLSLHLPPPHLIIIMLNNVWQICAALMDIIGANTAGLIFDE